MTPGFEMGFQIAVVWLEHQELFGDELRRFAGKRLRELKALRMSDEECVNILISELLAEPPQNAESNEEPTPTEVTTEADGKL